MRRLLRLGALLVPLWACDSPSEPTPVPDPSVSGSWTGRGRWGFGIPTPLDMTLVDSQGTFTGDGGGVDCRYNVLCGSFSSYSVEGSHENLTIVIEGTANYGKRWTLRGTLARDGNSMSGTGSGDDFDEGPWEMTRRQ